MELCVLLYTLAGRGARMVQLFIVTLLCRSLWFSTVGCQRDQRGYTKQIVLPQKNMDDMKGKKGKLCGQD